MDALEKQIDQKIGEIRTETVDLSFGEIISLHEKGELVIQPDYQRLFRWSDVQKSRLIESILVELPIPPIFVIENSDGVYELIDGLQRVSSVIQFVQAKSLNADPLILTDCELIPELNGKKFEDLPLSLKLRIKRVPARTVVIKRQSKYFLRYEMFKRLNTGGSLLSPQEIRNCSARMLDEHGVNFYTFIQKLAKYDFFSNSISSIAQEDLDQKGDEELVLRFFAAKNGLDMYRGSVRDWLDDYMEAILLKKIDFDYPSEEETFVKTFTVINDKLGASAFVRYRLGQPIGGLAPAYFEAVSIAFQRGLESALKKDNQTIQKNLADMVQSAEFRTVTGPGANSKQKLSRRIQLIEESLKKE